MTPTAADLAILRYLARRDHATAHQIGAACGLAPGELRTHVAWLETSRFVSSRPDPDARPPRRLLYVTTDGRRKVGIGETRG